MTRTGNFLLASMLLATCLSAFAANFEGVVTHVTDGDTVWVRPASGGAPRPVRLQGIDAPEICQAYGKRARQALTSRVLHQQVRVASSFDDDYQRVLGNISLGGQDLGRWMVSSGHAWSYRFRKDPGPFAEQEAQARRDGLGLWKERAPLPPREFRKLHGSCK
jgi:micrococcal nuclease